MWINLAILFFVLLQALFFATQGLFSAMVHLVVVIAAGAIAFALWEPITMGLLIDRMPETAWGVGLIAPFVLAMLGLRLAADALAKGNVHMPQAVNFVAGGAAGALAGLLAGGVAVIGLQFLGGADLGYNPYAMEAGKPQRAQRLWLRADDLAADAFSRLSNGAFATLSGDSINSRLGDLSEAAGTFQITARDFARASIRPANLTLDRAFRINVQGLPFAPGLVVETTIDVTGQTDAGGAADQDARFTVTPAQLLLIADHPDEGTAAFRPEGFATERGLAPFSVRRVAASTPAASAQAFAWHFPLPDGYEPRLFRIKHTPVRIEEVQTLPEDQLRAWFEPREDVAADDDGDGGRGEGDGNGGGDTSASLDDMVVRVTAELPERLSKNWINTGAPGARYEEDGIIAARGAVEIDPRQRVRGDLVADHFAHPPGTAVVRVAVDRRRVDNWLAGPLQAARDTAPPLLESDDGQTWEARGYVIHGSGNTIHINLSRQPLRSLSDDPIRQMRDQDTLYIYFFVAEGVRIRGLRIGGKAHDLDISTGR